MRSDYYTAASTPVRSHFLPSHFRSSLRWPGLLCYYGHSDSIAGDRAAFELLAFLAVLDETALIKLRFHDPSSERGAHTELAFWLTVVFIRYQRDWSGVQRIATVKEREDGAGPCQ